MGAIPDEDLHPQRRIEFLKDAAGNLHAGQDAFFLDDKLLTSRRIGGNGAQSGGVTVADVFGECKVDKFVYELVFCFHFRGILLILRKVNQFLVKIQLISVGRMQEAPLRELAERYMARIPRYMPFEAVVIPDLKTRTPNTEQQKLREGEAILARVAPGDFVVLMDERGKEFSSRELAEFIDRKAQTLSRNLTFIIGGPYGFSPAVYERADLKVALSRMTFTHEMARTLTCEQLYRAMTILRGEPYHHD